MKNTKKDIILGIDPGYAIVGWSFLEKEGSHLNLLRYGCITTPKEMPHAERLAHVFNDLNFLIEEMKPTIASIEELFFSKNVTTAIKVAESRGVILTSFILHHLPIYEFTPLQIKQALTGYGRADKNQIQQMVKTVLKLKEIPKPDDAADAIAVAITYANNIRL
jgi:crossover junction endodeoxyribonuclease RuvC